jgi:flagellar biosynthetic protein FliR
MNTFDIPIGWALGLALGTVRAGAFVAAGGFVPRSIPRMARATPAIAFGLLIGHPLPATLDAGQLVVLAAMNAFIGFSLGWLLGLAVQPFQIAGTLLDTASGMTVGSLFDKDSMTSPGPISKIVNHAGTTLIIILGGLGVSARVLFASVQAVALDGNLHAFAIVGPSTARVVSRVFRAGIELALPITSVLFLIELTLGLVSRVAPQVNAFLLGLPIKLLTVLFLISSLVVVFPATADRAIADGLATVRTVLRTFAG